MITIARILLAAALVTGVAQTNAKPSINITNFTDEQDRHLSGFSSVSVSGSFDVYLTQGANESVKVEADADEIDKIITVVENGVLKIYTKRNNNSGWNWGGTNKKRIVRVVAKDLNKIGLSGSGDVFFKDGFRTQDMVVSLSGSGDISGKLDVKKLDVSIVGSGDISLTGNAETSNVKVSGSGDYNGRSLITAVTAVRVVGSGDAAVNVSQKLDASVAGSGDVRYTGAVKQISTSKAGSGDIHKF
ncbi:head GIN domain-containing protein [Mucilaginibacter aquatilis]|uniref:DUF2807 domain-containing protein n=1 Tax=Mucilaginibacter aquatilis TaxID=1517760 RepID=A0A6I4I9S2_9SPHI|nr:head GIN domain-containing protein [Mucilaginibacter aquatilis]MVN90748.1 DUF2807 domain-containing protein [Mucilaginibacter aquatilis]